MDKHKMKKVRIIKVTDVDGRVEYTIQQKHFLFKWKWVNAWANSQFFSYDDSYPTLEEAKKHLCYFNGSKSKIEVVWDRKYDDDDRYDEDGFTKNMDYM